jgi:predicted Zn-dependent protease
MHEAANSEDATDKSAISPGPLAPAREMLGEMLIDLKQAQHALVELEAVMKKEPNRFRTYYHAARAAALTGDKAKAAEYYKQLVAMCPKGDATRKELAEARRYSKG